MVMEMVMVTTDDVEEINMILKDQTLDHVAVMVKAEVVDAIMTDEVDMVIHVILDLETDIMALTNMVMDETDVIKIVRRMLHVLLAVINVIMLTIVPIKQRLTEPFRRRVF